MNELLHIKLLTIGKTTITAGTLALSLLLLLATWWFSWLLQRAIDRALKHNVFQSNNTLTMMRQVLRYVLFLSGLLLALRALGINLSSFFTAGAFFAVGIGLALQKMTQSFVAGIVLMLEHTIKPGDILEVDNEMVRVVEMGFRATVVCSRTQEHMIIPNYQLAQNTLRNYTLRDTVFRISTKIGVVYGSDLDKVERVLREAAEAMPTRHMEHPVMVALTEFGSSSIDFNLMVCITDPWLAPKRRGELHMSIWRAFQREEIKLAFPQMDIHVKSISDDVKALLTHERD